MSYLHCPSCSRAYNIAAQSSCPFCPVHATPVDPTEDIVAAAESLARAMSRATPAERGAAAARMDRLALPAPDAEPATFRGPRWSEPANAGERGTFLRSIRNALAPVPKVEPRKPQPLVASIAYAILGRLVPHTPKRLLRAATAVHARVKALAA